MTAAFLADPPCKGSNGFCSPSTDSFIFKPFVKWEWFGVHFEINKLTILIWIGIAAIAAFFLYATRRVTLVPSKAQWMAEETYGFVRNGIGEEVIGHDGVRFAPYLATLFVFVLVTNLFGIIPFAQISPNSHIAYPAFLAIISWIIYNWLGIRKHGFIGYFKDIMFPPGIPWPIYIILAPIEFISTVLVRPVTLAVRLFANMFAGHLILLVFTLGGIYLLSVHNFSKIFSIPAFIMAIALTFLEVIVQVLQAYVFTVLTASYIQGALAEEH
jgi:F-type H+-transporting ATPase subunit a